MNKNEGLKKLMNKYVEKTFVEALRDGEINVGSIDDYIEYWHTHNTNKNLRDFLGLTQNEYDMWVAGFITSKNYEESLMEVLGAVKVPTEVPVCKICGDRMGVRTAIGVIATSNYIGGDICYDCQIEHCLSTNCLNCDIGNKLDSYADCEHLNRKKCYMEEERLERDDAVKKKVGDINDRE